ncbi:response regulator [Sphingomonas sinipercae]|uniref:histidine kinase n=1 Tax=Sphingomonas sinipercae TaxID=2714944 RepID=A0A6G7ZPV0_9SPHN|nr:response regulator [Sphingomonas sinipercae]QIL02949.1 response regulator [Sphingomonas sinipercae]
MLQPELPRTGNRPLSRAEPWLLPAIAAAAAISIASLLWLGGYPVAAALVSAAAIAGLIAAAAAGVRTPAVDLRQVVAVPDFSVVGSTLALAKDPIAICDAQGSLLLANDAYREKFEGGPPPSRLAVDDESRQALGVAVSMAWRDGAGCSAGIATSAGPVAVEVERIGARGDLLLWRFPRRQSDDPVALAASRVSGATGEKLGRAGILAALTDGEGAIVSANRPFVTRALDGADPGAGTLFGNLVSMDDDGHIRLLAEGEAARPLRAVHIPLDPPAPDGHGIFYLFDSPDSLPLSSSSHLQSMLDILPIGLALVDRDGRFLTMNDAFRAAAGLKSGARPVYPGDMVVKEDKAAVADAVRRNARGPAMSGDLAIRLARSPKEPVALTIAGLRGLGDAAVLLLLKDNSEEAKLKRQVAQATKMQAVGQLAGGVAHDFNNILTAIIGHCDLMLMRHTPGDSDYDDIQQIKLNSNRAAGLTRQLLAFSRQQTLRPQVLQLTDVVAEVSHLLKRLLGETVKLVVKHGRNLGSIRADPGQLEQVIINLAVNARDAMVENGGGTLTIQTYAVRSDQVAELGSDILPIADYSALSVTDTGCGIEPKVLGKVFEPFFTTKEIGKGTGLGLSTVYGIVKQSGGFIFADSKVGEGTRFVIYLPVHQVEADASKAAPVAKPKPNELWGSGTVLLVEDEPMVRTVAERALTRHGYTVMTANNGEEALEVLSHSGDDIVLLISDVVMPMMDGPTMVREARKDRPELPILFMSGYAEEQLRRSIDLDNVAFLPKPFSVQELAEAARKALEPKPLQDAAETAAE